jgi:hypothetical protein
MAISRGIIGDSLGIIVSKAFVKGKIANQSNLLWYFAKSRKEERVSTDFR